MAAPLVNTAMALRNQLSRDLIRVDGQRQRRTFVALLFALDNYYKQNVRIQRSEDMSGESLQVDFQMAGPTWSGVDALNASYATNTMSKSTAMSMVAGTFGWSGYQFQETIRKALMERISGGKLKSAANYISKISRTVTSNFYRKLDDDLFPNSFPAPSSVNTNHVASATRTMSLLYPLQTGGTNNAAPSTENYLYGNLDLNDSTGPNYTQIKALSVGNTTTAFGTPTVSNFRTKIMMPLTDRGANIDVIGVDHAVYDFMLGQAEAKLQINMADRLSFGGTYIDYLGLPIAVFEKLNQYATLGRRMVPFLDSSTWRFHTKPFGEDRFALIKDLEGLPTAMMMQGWHEVAFLCEDPSFNGLAYNVTLT